ncbi:4'-phosphopantetheinyl transferase family protein [Streptomyces sedi]|uniref:4'-phosphopantetheinyl transferase superfamily protein n=1 Tax=Streptomyces sedi TaxID=555059 RepID=A0A5C4V478_9ACTN|nr:4'-phosphopantetheinyl transferase superfamily protein [Streptomyces sedi]TNM30583.1 4'-phosphopantetheinyl transferase superfamily protein [Streptomyces sedi]
MTWCGVRVLATPELEVWYGSVAGRGRRGAALPLPTPAERERAGTFVHAAEGIWYLVHRLATRRILADRLRCGPEDVVIGRSSCPGCGSFEHGPPRLFAPRTPLTLSLSRSGPHWLLALAPGGGRVGADIELLGDRDVTGLAKVCLTPAEQRRLRSTEPAARGVVFHRCWTRKEAVAKALGTGLAAGLSRIETGLGSSTAVRSRVADRSTTVVAVDGRPGGRFVVRDLRLPAGLAGAVAWEPPPGSPLRGGVSPLSAGRPAALSSQSASPRFIK